MTPQKLIHSSKSWVDFVEKISKFQDKKRGTHFEWFVKFYLLSNPKYRLYYEKLWHSSEYPKQTEHVSKLKLPIPEQGYDLIGLTKDGYYEIIQCKYKDNIFKNLVYKDIDSSIRVATASPTKNFIKSIKMCSNLQGITRDENIDSQAVKINGIFGGTFEGLNEEDFSNIRKVIDDEIPVFKKIKKKSHQNKAIKLIKKHFVDDKESRGQIIHACGTGKTLTSYYAYSELKPKLTIYLVPSLQLITQTLNAWSKESMANNEAISPFIVCSDKTNEKIEESDPALWLHELGIKVSNKKQEIERFLKSKQPRKVIFSTYQSSKILAANLNKLNIVPDFCFFDEAHNTTSSKYKMYSHLLSNDNLLIKQRLFLTATPKVLRGKNHKYYSMDNEKHYGKVIDEITFKAAIEELKMLNDYRIITQVVSDTDARTLLHSNPFVIDQDKLPEEVEVKLIASALTIKKVIKDKKIKNIISFHHRRNRALAFANGINNIDMGTYINHFYVDGKQSGTMRQRILAEFANTSPSLVANARCLSEGVDVPAIDSVIFVDPKQSRGSITQAIGRALRKPKEQKKGISYIIVPTIINKKNTKNIDESYQEILMVLRSMSEHDGRIVEYFRLMKEGKKPPIKFLEVNTEHLIHDFDLEDFSNSLHIKAWDRIAKIGRRPFEHVRAYVQKSDINTQEQWFEFAKSDAFPPDFPSNVSRVYKKEWTSWPDFLRGESSIRLEKKSFQDLRAFAHKSPINTISEWKTFSISDDFPDDFPVDPRQAYQLTGEWTNWYDFLGKKAPVKFKPFEEVRSYAQKSPINTQTEWRDFAVSDNFPVDFPSDPSRAYEEDWVSWYDFLGNPAPIKVSPFEEVRAYVQKSDINTQEQWFKFAKSDAFPPDFPSNPSRTYEEDWVSWYDFFGKDTPIN